MTQYRVYYNSDCAMYGIQELRADISYKGDTPRWTQILPLRTTQGARRGKSAYTYYLGVANRWLNEYKELER